MNKKKSFLTKASAILIWLLIWEVASRFVGISWIFASPMDVLAKLLKLAPTASFVSTVLHSSLRILSGFVIGTTLGIVMAFISSKFNWFRMFLSPLLISITSVPVVSFIILALLWFSSNTISILIAAMITFPILYTHLLTAIQTTPKNMLEMAKVFELSKFRTFRYIYIPHIFVYFDAACSLAMGLAWKAGIAAEVLGTPEGSIGEHLYQSKVYLDSAGLLAWTIVIVLLSLMYEKVWNLLLTSVRQWLERVPE